MRKHLLNVKLLTVRSTEVAVAPGTSGSAVVMVPLSSEGLVSWEAEGKSRGLCLLECERNFCSLAILVCSSPSSSLILDFWVSTLSCSVFTRRCKTNTDGSFSSYTSTITFKNTTFIEYLQMVLCGSVLLFGMLTWKKKKVQSMKPSKCHNCSYEHDCLCITC